MPHAFRGAGSFYTTKVNVVCYKTKNIFGVRYSFQQEMDSLIP